MAILDIQAATTGEIADELRLMLQAEKDLALDAKHVLAIVNESEVVCASQIALDLGMDIARTERALLFLIKVGAIKRDVSNGAFELPIYRQA